MDRWKIPHYFFFNFEGFPNHLTPLIIISRITKLGKTFIHCSFLGGYLCYQPACLMKYFCVFNQSILVLDVCIHVMLHNFNFNHKSHNCVQYIVTFCMHSHNSIPNQADILGFYWYFWKYDLQIASNIQHSHIQGFETFCLCK